MRYHVNVQTPWERSLYIEAGTPEEAEAKAREMGLADPHFWDREHWLLAADADEDYFVEESP